MNTTQPPTDAEILAYARREAKRVIATRRVNPANAERIARHAQECVEEMRRLQREARDGR